MPHPFLAPTLVSLATLALVGSVLADGETAPGRVRVERLSWGGWAEAFRLTNGTVEVVVVPASARILHYGFVGEANVLWQNASASGHPVAPGTWTNYGGSKTWLWPQEDWPARTGSGWPPPTDLPATIVNAAELVDGPVLRLTSPKLAGFDVVVVREIRMEGSGSRIHITSRIEKRGEDATFAVAPWTVTQLSADGALFARLLPGSRPPGGFRTFSGAFASAALEGTDILCVQRQPKTSAKIGMDADVLAWQRGDLLFVERSVDATSPLSSFAVGDRGQFYTHPDGDPTLPAGVSYIEMELTAPLTTLRSGASAVLETTWELIHLPPAEQTREAVAARLRKM